MIGRPAGALPTGPVTADAEPILVGHPGAGEASDPLESAIRGLERLGVPLWLPPSLLAALVALVDVSGWSLWYDEVATYSAIDRSIPDLLRMLGNIDAALGFWYLLLHLWSLVAGTSEFALRVPSVAATAAAVAITTLIGRRLGGRSTAVGAGIILALTPMLTSHHAQEARPYALAVLLACLSTWLLLIADERRGVRWWVGYGAAVAALGLTHFLALVILPAHLAWCALGDRRRTLGSWVLTTSIALVAPTVVVAISLGQGGVWDWIQPVTVETLLRVPVVSVGDGSLGWLLVGFGFAGIGALTFRGRALLAGWLLGPPIALLVLSVVVRPMFVERYLLFAAPALALLAAIGLGRTRLLLPGLLLVTALAIPAAMHWRDRPGRFEDYRGAASWLLARAQPDDVIVYEGQRYQLGFRYELRDAVDPPTDLRSLGTAADDGWLAEPMREPSADLLEGRGRIWVVHGTDGPALGAWPGALDGLEVSDEQAFKGQLVVSLYVRGEADPAR